MIVLHRLNNSEIILNANMIEIIESTPDTMITLTNDRKYIVKESAEDVVNRVIAYNKKIFQTVPTVGRTDKQ